MQVVSKIIKHGREVHFGTGTLLGLDFDGTMEVSNSFPLPGFSEEEDRGAKSAAQRESFLPRPFSIVCWEELLT